MYLEHINGKVDPGLRTADRPESREDDGGSRAGGKTGLSHNAMNDEFDSQENKRTLS